MRWDAGSHIQLQFMDCPMCAVKLKTPNAPVDINGLLINGDRVILMVKQKAT